MLNLKAFYMKMDKIEHFYSLINWQCNKIDSQLTTVVQKQK